MDPPHLVLVPFPAQGHVKPMLMLAELLCHAGVYVTFVNTDHIHRRLLCAAGDHRLPGLSFASIPDGLPPDHPRGGDLVYFRDLFASIRSTCKPKFKDLVTSLGLPITCVISDGIMSFGLNVAEELGIPAIAFRTYSACCTWTYFHISRLVEEGEIPFSDENMDRTITCIPGLENLFRRRDLPSVFRVEAVEDPVLQFFIHETSAMTRASALILNTFEELEAPFIHRLRSLFPKLYTIC